MTTLSSIDITIRELAELIGKVVGYAGEIVFDVSKPDGALRKLLDVNQVQALDWIVKVELEPGLRAAYEGYLTQLRSSR